MIGFALIPSLPDLFNAREKRGAYYPKSRACRHDVGPYTRVGRVVRGENCTWASTI